MLCSGSVHCKGVAGAFWVSADSMGVSGELKGWGWARLNVGFNTEFAEEGRVGRVGGDHKEL